MTSNKKSKNVDEDLEGTGVVYVINKFKVKNKTQPFRCVMIYQDRDSGFCFIKPLLYKIDLELVMELFKIFVTYGPPLKVHVNSCSQEMVVNIATNMKVLCPFWDIDFIKKNVDTNDIVMLVITKLHEWMELTGKDQWEIGCCIIQWDINTTKNADEKTPHELFFTKEISCASDYESDEECTNQMKKSDLLIPRKTPETSNSQVNVDMGTTVKVKVERLDSDVVEQSDDLQNFSSVHIKQENE